MKNFKLFSAILALLISVSFSEAQNQNCPVIPQPVKAVKKEGAFLLNRYTSIRISGESLAGVAAYLQYELLADKRLPLSIGNITGTPAINISISRSGKSPAEGYRLNISKERIDITAGSEKGAFYGVISLLQLIKTQDSSELIKIPAWNIEDKPLYTWRGLMLDESRHFFGKATVKKLLDWMAFYKLNTFHWHLTDEPGWRIEIKQYPLLTLVGGIGNYTDKFGAAQYYTQEDIKEIVDYAAKRFITIIPEIDMPGHATAANRAYPQYTGGGNDKHPNFTFNPGNASTYLFLSNILREVNALFPARMLHVGGDEVSFGNDKWLADIGVQRLLEKKKLKDVKGVERYFMERMADSIYNMNAKMLAWDEVADMNLDKNKTILFWWRHDQPRQLTKALSKKYDIVLCPRLPFYFDFVQDSTHTLGRKWGEEYNSLEHVYNFNINKIQQISASNRQQILGIQANLWTETIKDEKRLCYMIFPRIAALAETAWTDAGNKSFSDFKANLEKQYRLYSEQQINFYQAAN
ncbi:MAG: beta-N-acetylhexosaminidase [Niabella sp.]